MKRKIAMLMSAMMVFSAMPMTANAAYLEPGSVLMPGYAKANNTIDANYKLPYGTNSLTVQQLKERQSVLTVDLKQDKTGIIKAGSSFDIELTNGYFDKSYEQYFQYVNSTGSLPVYSNDLNNTSTLKNAYEVIAQKGSVANPLSAPEYPPTLNTNVTESGKLTTGSVMNLNSHNMTGKTAYTALQETIKYLNVLDNNNLKNLYVIESTTPADKYYVSKDGKPTADKIGGSTGTIPSSNLEFYVIIDEATGAEIELDGTEAQFIKVVNAINGTNYSSLAEIEKAIATEYADEYNTGGNKVELPHIPYEFEITSPTTAKVTVPYTLTNDELKIENISGGTIYDTNKMGITFADDTGNIISMKDKDPSPSTGTSSGNGFDIATLVKVEGLAVTDKGNAKTTGTQTVESSYLAIPLGAVIAENNGEVKAKVVNRYDSNIFSGEKVLTKNDANGDTTLIYPEKNVKYFEDYTNLESILISESVRNTIGRETNNTNIKDRAKVNLRLSSGFQFKLNQSDLSVSGTAQSNGNYTQGTLRVFNDRTGQELEIIPATIDGSKYLGTLVNDSTISFEVNLANMDRTNPTGLRIEYYDGAGSNANRVGLPIEASNSKNYGEVDLTVSGDGINTQSKLVAKRESLGFELKTLKDPKEMIAGRHYTPNNYALDNNGNLAATKNGTMLEGDNTTVEIKFSEKVPNTLVEARALDFTVPEGVKIVDAYIDYNSVRNIVMNGSGDSGKFDDSDFEIINNGRTLRLKRDSYTVMNQDSLNKLATFNFKLDLSIDPSVQGDIELTVTGGGQSDETKAVIAKAVTPFEIKTQVTKANMGYQDYNTADITITETKPGMFLENKTAILELKAPYGTQELGFSAAQFEVAGGQLNVKDKDFKIDKNGVISFHIDKASYKDPASITIKNVKVGTTRSVPYGAYSLALYGDAVINNYAEKLDDNRSFNINTKGANSDKKYFALYNQNNTSHFATDYLEIVTETGTFDKTVKVSVGDKTVLVGDQAIDMDVAPYIQATSNSTMVPLRFVSVALGVDSASVTNPDASNKISWDQNTKTATIYYGAGTGQKIIQFQAGSNIMTVDGTRIPMEYGVKAEIKDGRMFVPFRALGQALGVNVAWDADTRTAIYNGDNARNASVTTTASTTASTTTESTTESTTASDSTTESTTAKQ